jgi:hypothetical protein
MRTYILLGCLLCSLNAAQAQLFKKPVFSGVYLQWGYNRDWFSKSDIHFSNGSSYDFTIHKASAQDQPDFSGFRDSPWDVTIPQNSYRIGVYLNKTRTHAIELNFDHAKYVMDDFRNRRVSGQVHGEPLDIDTFVTPYFVDFEHTNGANFYHINYVRQHDLIRFSRRSHASGVLKLGAGVVIPRSDVTIMGRKLDNEYHVAGYIISAEAGLRFYPRRHLFVEFTGKGGFANYLNVLTVDGGKANHHFYYGSVVGLVGLELFTKLPKRSDILKK